MSTRMFQLEKLELDLTHRLQFNIARIHDDFVVDEEDISFYADRAIRIERIISRIRSRSHFFLFDKSNLTV